MYTFLGRKRGAIRLMRRSEWIGRTMGLAGRCDRVARKGKNMNTDTVRTDASDYRDALREPEVLARLEHNMRTIGVSRRAFLAFATTVAGSAALAACGGGASPTATSAPTTAPSPAAAASPTSAPTAAAAATAPAPTATSAPAPTTAPSAAPATAPPAPTTAGATAAA